MADRSSRLDPGGSSAPWPHVPGGAGPSRTQRRRSAALGSALTLAAAASLGGCGGSGFDGHVFRNQELAFRVDDVPPEWRPLEAQGVLLAFRDDAAEASVAIGGRCGKDGDDVPLEALTQHLFLHFTERQVQRQQLISLAGREALRTELDAKLDGVARHFTVVVLKKDACVYDFMLVASPRSPATTRERFDRFVAKFSTLEP